VRSCQLESALSAYLEEASVALMAETAAGAEVPFEVVAESSRRHGTPLYCYRPLTRSFMDERAVMLGSLPSRAAALQAMGTVGDLDRYLAVRAAGVPAGPAAQWANKALELLLEDVFAEQDDFQLRTERVDAALGRLQESGERTQERLAVLATLHGMVLASGELELTRGLALVNPGAVPDAPSQVLPLDEADGHLLAVLAGEGDDPRSAVPAARGVLRDLLRALRLFGDGRVTLGPMAWWRMGGGPWRPFALGAGGRPRGMLVVSPEQEDELRAFCNLVSRRAPHGNEVAWALRRYELGCERTRDDEAVSDYLLALRALLEPEGPASGRLAERMAVLCAVPERRAALAERVARTLALERAVIDGSVSEAHGSDATVGAVADHLRDLLRDVVCGHLAPDLDRVADELLQQEREGSSDQSHQAGSEDETWGARPASESAHQRDDLAWAGPPAPPVPEGVGAATNVDAYAWGAFSLLE